MTKAFSAMAARAHGAGRFPFLRLFYLIGHFDALSSASVSAPPSPAIVCLGSVTETHVTIDTVWPTLLPRKRRKRRRMCVCVWGGGGGGAHWAAVGLDCK